MKRRQIPDQPQNLFTIEQVNWSYRQVLDNYFLDE